MPGPANSIIVKNVPRSTNADVWDEWADEDEDDDFLSPEMRERLKALVLSAPIAALAGALSLPYTQIVTPEVMSVLRTVDALLAALIGGVGLIFGPAVGAVIFTILPQFLDLDPNVKVLVFSLLIILVMVAAPGGLHQLWKAAAARLSHARREDAP